MIAARPGARFGRGIALCGLSISVSAMPPIDNSACGVSLDGPLKDFHGVEIPIGVLIAHSAVEATLSYLVARGLKMHVAKLLIHIVLRE